MLKFFIYLRYQLLLWVLFSLRGCLRSRCTGRCAHKVTAARRKPAAAVVQRRGFARAAAGACLLQLPPARSRRYGRNIVVNGGYGFVKSVFPVLGRRNPYLALALAMRCGYAA